MIELSVIRDFVAIADAFIGLTYYITNIREIRYNRKIALTTSVFENFMSDEGVLKMLELLSMEWDDIEDYLEKHDSRVDPENAAKRISMRRRCETIGLLYRKGLLDFETLRASSGEWIGSLWLKFKPIIEYYRGTHMVEDAYNDFEYIGQKVIDYERERGKREFGIPDTALGEMLDEYQPLPTKKK